MKTFRTQKRLAAKVLGVGINKVWFDPARINDIAEALTRADMEELIKDNAIMAKKNIRTEFKKMGKKRRETGSIRKKIKRRKQEYVQKIRKLRKYIGYLRENEIIVREEYHKLRNMSKAGQFRNKRHLKEYVKDVLKKAFPAITANKKNKQAKTKK